MSLLHSLARGLEHEYAVNTYPPDMLSRRFLIDFTLNEAKKAGYAATAAWSIEDEAGNLEYEKGIRSIWSLDEGPYQQAFNGMRIYNDAMHFEVSNPVCSDPLEMITYSRVGEVLVELAACKVGDKVELPVYSYKNNTSTVYQSDYFESVSYGTHGNYSVSRSRCSLDHWREVRRALIPYMVCRILLFGTGEMIPVEEETRKAKLNWDNGKLQGRHLRFAISPRGCFVRHVSHIDTSVERGILNERDEPHADPNKYFRLHDIHWEASRCDVQQFVTDVMQTFVLRAFEAGLLDDAPELRNPVEAINTLALDSEEFNWQVQLKDGSRVDAVKDILVGYYLTKVKELVSKHGGAEDRQAFETVTKILDRLQARDIDSLVWVLDWPTKRMLLKEYEATDSEALTVCNQYSLIDGSIRWYLGEAVDLDSFDCLFSPEEAFEAATKWLPGYRREDLIQRVTSGLMHGPRTTRDFTRSFFVSKFNGEIVKSSWARLYAKDGAILEMPEPLQYGADRVEKILESGKTVGELFRALRELRG